MTAYMTAICIASSVPSMSDLEAYLPESRKQPLFSTDVFWLLYALPRKFIISFKIPAGFRERIACIWPWSSPKERPFRLA